MLQRIDAGRRDVGVVREIARSVEQAVRVAPFVPAERVEVRARIDAGRCHVGIVEQVMLRVEAVHHVADRRVGGAALRPAELHEVRERIDSRAATSGLWIR